MTKVAENQAKTVFVERLVALIADTPGMNPRRLSRSIGKNDSYVGQLINGKGGMPGAEPLFGIARELGTTTDYLVGKVDNPAQLVSEVSFREMPQQWRRDDLPGVPLVGTAFCADLVIEVDGGDVEVEQLLLETDHTVRMVERPSGLWNVREAYAILFQGNSMERRFYQGDIGFVDPRRPPSPGQIGLFQLTDGKSNGVVTALAKELVRASSAYVELLQYNPELTFRIPRARVAAMHRIFRPDELIQY